MSILDLSTGRTNSSKSSKSQEVLIESQSSAHGPEPSYSFMEKRLKCCIMEDGEDVTPENIVDSSYVTMEQTYTHAALDSKKRSKLKSEMILRAKSKSKSLLDVGMKVFATTIDLDDIHIDHTIDTEEGYRPEDADLEQAPSAFYLPKMIPPTSYPPEIRVDLKETGTIELFALPSISYERGTADANAVEEQNEFYAYITVGKGRNRKMGNQETQTRSLISQTRHTLAKRPKKKNQISFASMWDMHDTYEQLALEEEVEEEDEMVMYQCAAAYLLRKKRLKKKNFKKRPTTFEEIGQLHAFFDAALLCQRVLAAIDFSPAQKIYRGLGSFDPLAMDLVYIYTMEPLWTFECEETFSRPITSISFNEKNQDILAVGHGKFGYADKLSGIVCIWCTKNPCKPERIYRFETPVTSVGFSRKNPNWLACAFSNGDVIILDITFHHVHTVAVSKRDTNPCFEPIWCTQWISSDAENEFVMTAGQDGRINKFTSTKTHDFICTPMMRISTVEGKMKGLETPKPCIKVDVPITRYPAALCVKWHPRIKHIYLVGTDQGCIHKCSTHYLNQHMDVFKAHGGPVYNLIYSPFMSTLFVTCGADSAIRIWIEDIDDEIITLNHSAAVYDMAFCPVNSTILISVSGNVLSVWDLRRKTHMPCTDYTFPSNVLLTYVRFAPSGDNLFVADTLGRIYTFHLLDTPIPPYYQRQMLDEAIKRALCTRPLLLLQLEKMEMFRDKYAKASN